MTQRLPDARALSRLGYVSQYTHDSRGEIDENRAPRSVGCYGGVEQSFWVCMTAAKAGTQRNISRAWSCRLHNRAQSRISHVKACDSGAGGRSMRSVATDDGTLRRAIVAAPQHERP